MCSCHKKPVQQQMVAKSFPIPLIQGSEKAIPVGLGEPLILDRQLVRTGRVEMSPITFHQLKEARVNIWSIF
jgi:hypothetical protein